MSDATDTGTAGAPAETDVPAGADVDLDAHYWRERKALFGLFSAAIVASLVREWQLEGRLPEAARLAGLRGADYVLSQVDAQGVVQGVSYGTRMGPDLQFYRDIPLQPTAYGQSLALLCLAEALHHPETR